MGNPDKPIQFPLNVVVYKVKKGRDEEFKKLLALHWPTLDKLGLVTKEPARIWRGANLRSESEGSSWVELFSWKDLASPEIAHQTPEIMRIWEPMGPLLEGMDILHVEPVAL